MSYHVPNRNPNREPPATSIIVASIVLVLVLIPILDFLNTLNIYRQQHADINLLFQKPNKVALIPLMIAVPSLIVSMALDMKSKNIIIIRFSYGISAILILAAIYLFLTRTNLVAAYLF